MWPKGPCMIQTSNIHKTATQIDEYWSPQVIGKLDDYYIKMAKLKGQLTWHSHAEQDELFLIIKGSLTMQYEDQTVTLKEGDVHIVPKGIEHNPIAEKECLVLLVEHASTLHTGDIVLPESKSVLQQLHQFQQVLKLSE